MRFRSESAMTPGDSDGWRLKGCDETAPFWLRGRMKGRFRGFTLANCDRKTSTSRRFANKLDSPRQKEGIGIIRMNSKEQEGFVLTRREMIGNAMAFSVWPRLRLTMF